MRLKHITPELNDRNMWYAQIGQTDSHRLVVIHGPVGQVSSTVHAVPIADYVEDETMPKAVTVAKAKVTVAKAPMVESIDEFI